MLGTHMCILSTTERWPAAGEAPTVVNANDCFWAGFWDVMIFPLIGFRRGLDTNIVESAPRAKQGLNGHWSCGWRFLQLVEATSRHASAGVSERRTL